MKSILTVLFFALFAATLSAQNSQISGRVFDSKTNQPISGASVQTSNKQGAFTDKNGTFTISCTSGMTVSVTFIGYSKYKSKITDCNQNLEIGLAPQSQELEAVEITATSNLNRALLDQSESIVKLSKTEIDRETGLYLDDALNTNVPGVIMERRSNSGGQQINIRGYGNGFGFKGISNNFDTQGSKVYLNGIPITTADGLTVMDDIDFASLSNLEVKKGPSGTLYGMAIAGVLNLEIAGPKKGESYISQDVMTGSYGLLRTTTSVGIGSEKSSILINYGHQEFDGFMVHTAAHKNYLNFSGTFDLNDRQKLNTYVGYSDSYDERNGELTEEQYANKDYSGNPRYIKNDAHSAVKGFRAGIGHTYKLADWISNTTSFFGSSAQLNNSSAGGWTDAAPTSYGLRSTFDMNFKLSEKLGLSSISGVELQETRGIGNSYKMIADSTNLDGYNTIGSVRGASVTTSDVASYFTQWTLQIPYDICLTAGIGFTTLKSNVQDRLWANGNNHAGNTTPKKLDSKYTNMVAPSFGINKKINDKVSVYGSYSSGFNAPTASQSYISYTGQINSGLTPEKGSQIEVGTKGNLMDKKLFYTVAFFQTIFSDKLTKVAVPDPDNTVTLYSYITNGGSINNKGIEALIKYDAIQSGTGFFTRVSPFANVTLSNFKYEDFTYETIGSGANGNDSLQVQDYSGNQVAGVPPVVFNIGVDAMTKVGLYANATFNYRDAMYFTSDELHQTDSYNLLNAKIGFRKTINHIRFDIYAGARNITGSQYYEMVFVNQLPDAYIPGPSEINYYGGVNVGYVF